jgi:hypothetical protein
MQINCEFNYTLIILFVGSVHSGTVVKPDVPFFYPYFVPTAQRVSDA